MKFDKFMNICYRILSVIIGIVVVVGFFVSCFGKSIVACADELGWLTAIFDYEDEFRENLITATRSANDALNDSNLSDEEKRNIRSVLAFQEFCLRTMPSIYGTPTNPILPDSDTVTFSGSGSSGVYKSRLDGKLHSIFCSGFNGFSGTLMNSDEFVVTLSFAKSDHQYTRLPTTFYNASSGLSFGVRPSGSCQLFYCNLDCDTSYFNDYSYYVPGSMNENTNILWYISPDPYQDYLGSLAVQTLQDNSPFLGGYKVVAYSGATSTLPSGTVDTESPWDYYDNILLPYMRNNYPDVTNNYFVFPNGYNQPVDPTEPPTFPNSGIYIDKQYNIGINIIYPTESNGQPVTDASGETVTETEYITDTSPLDGEYSFLMPTLPRLNMYDSTLPNPDISAYSDGITWIWNMSYNVLTESGFMPVVMIVFALALLGFILWKLGG